MDNDTAANVSLRPVGAPIQIIGSGFVETGATSCIQRKGEKNLSPLPPPVVHLGVNADVITDTEIRVHVPGYMYTKAEMSSDRQVVF